MPMPEMAPRPIACIASPLRLMGVLDDDRRPSVKPASALREKLRDTCCACVMYLATGVKNCMSQDVVKYRVDLMGPFRLSDADGRRVDVASKRGQALIATLAVSRGGDRTRSWLQERLWGSRQLPQAQASLRRELSNLRRAVNGPSATLIDADHNRVWLNLDLVEVVQPSAQSQGEFLEGLDIPGEEAFEDWLRDQRRVIEAQLERDAAGQILLPEHIVDVAKPVPGFANRPAIAILPLNNQTGDERLAYVADGISEELCELLARLKWLPVIARSASFLYRGREVELRQIGASLGARYIVEGSLRRTGDQLRLGLQMADVETGLSIWSHTSDIPPDFTQAILDDLIREIVGVLDMHVDAAEKTRASSKTPDPTSVNDLIWRGRWHLHRFTRADAELAEACFRQALELAPNSAEALIQMTFFHSRSIWTEREGAARIRTFGALAQQAIAADGSDGRAYMFAGMAELWVRNSAAALPLFEKAVALNPSLSLAHGQIGSTRILQGDFAAADAPLRLALRLGPNDEHSFLILGELAIAHFFNHQWDLAISHADQSLLRRRAYWHAHMTKICALGNKGDWATAELATRQLLQVKPDFNLSFVDWLPFVDPKWNAILKGALQKAGID